jgi:hypothetical protein
MINPKKICAGYNFYILETLIKQSFKVFIDAMDCKIIKMCRGNVCLALKLQTHVPNPVGCLIGFSSVMTARKPAHLSTGN